MFVKNERTLTSMTYPAPNTGEADGDDFTF